MPKDSELYYHAWALLIMGIAVMIAVVVVTIISLV